MAANPKFLVNITNLKKDLEISMLLGCRELNGCQTMLLGILIIVYCYLLKYTVEMCHKSSKSCGN